MTTPDLKSLIKTLAEREAAISSRSARSREGSEQAAADVSYQRRVARGKLDIARAELVTRRGNENDDGSETSGVRQPRPPGPHRDAGGMELPVLRPVQDNPQAA
jgi:hypothetical protein